MPGDKDKKSNKNKKPNIDKIIRPKYKQEDFLDKTNKPEYFEEKPEGYVDASRLGSKTRAGNIDMSEYEDYIDPRFIDLNNIEAANLRRAQAQSTGEKLRRGAGNLVTDFVVGIVGDVGAIAEIGLGMTEEDPDFSNAVMRWAEDNRDAFGEVYRKDPDSIIDWSDPAFYINNIQDLISSVAQFAVAGKGIGSVVGKTTASVARGTSKIAKAGSTLVRTEKLANAILSKGSKFNKFLTGPGNRIATSAMLSNLENSQQSMNAYKTVYDSAIEKGLGEKEAAGIASKAAQESHTIGTLIGTALNVGIVSPFFKPGNVSSKLKGMSIPRKYKDIAKQRKFIENYKQSKAYAKQLKEGNTWGAYLKEGGQEMVEEFSNVATEEYGISLGLSELEGDKSRLGAIESALDKGVSEEGWLSMGLGFIGGMGHNAIINRVPFNQRYKRDGKGNLVNKTDKSGNPIENKYKKEWVSNYRRIKDDREQIFQEHQKGFLNDLSEIEKYQQQLKDLAEKGELDEMDIRNAKDAIFNVSTFNNVVTGRGQNLIQDYENIAALDNEKELSEPLIEQRDKLNEEKEVIQKGIQEKGEATQEEQQSLADIDKELNNLNDQISELGNKTEAMLEGFARNKEDNEYKEEAKQAVKDIKDAEKAFNTFSGMFVSEEDQEYQIANQVTGAYMEAKLAKKRADRYEKLYEQDVNKLKEELSHDKAEGAVNKMEIEIIESNLNSLKEEAKNYEKSNEAEDKLSLVTVNSQIAVLERTLKEKVAKHKESIKNTYGEIMSLTEDKQKIAAELGEQYKKVIDSEIERSKREAQEQIPELERHIKENKEFSKNQSKDLKESAMLDVIDGLDTLKEVVAEENLEEKADTDLLKQLVEISKMEDKETAEGMLSALIEERNSKKEAAEKSKKAASELEKKIEEYKKKLEETEESSKEYKEKLEKRITEDDSFIDVTKQIEKASELQESLEALIDKKIQSSYPHLVDRGHKFLNNFSASEVKEREYRESLTKEGKRKLIDRVKQYRKDKANMLEEIKKEAEKEVEEQIKKNKKEEERNRKNREKKQRDKRKEKAERLKKEREEGKAPKPTESSDTEETSDDSKELGTKEAFLDKVLEAAGKETYDKVKARVEKGYEIWNKTDDKDRKAIYRLLDNAVKLANKLDGDDFKLASDVLSSLYLEANNGVNKFMKASSNISKLDKEKQKLLKRLGIVKVENMDNLRESLKKVEEEGIDIIDEIVGEAYSKASKQDQTEESSEEADSRENYDKLQELISEDYKNSGLDKYSPVVDRFNNFMNNVIDTLKSAEKVGKIMDSVGKDDRLETARLILDRAKKFYSLMSQETENYPDSFLDYKLTSDFELVNDSADIALKRGNSQDISNNSFDISFGSGKKAERAASLSDNKSTDFDRSLGYQTETSTKGTYLETEEVGKGSEVTFHVVDDPDIPMYDFDNMKDGKPTKTTWGEYKKRIQRNHSEQESDYIAYDIPIKARFKNGEEVFLRTLLSSNEHTIAKDISGERKKLSELRKKIYNSKVTPVGRVVSISAGSFNVTTDKSFGTMENNAPGLVGKTSVGVLKDMRIQTSKDNSIGLSKKQRDQVITATDGVPYIIVVDKNQNTRIMGTVSTRIDGKFKNYLKEGTPLEEGTDDLTNVVYDLINNILGSKGKERNRNWKNLAKLIEINGNTDTMDDLAYGVGEESAVLFYNSKEKSFYIGNQGDLIKIESKKDLKDKSSKVTELIGKIRSNLNLEFTNTDESVPYVDSEGNTTTISYNEYQAKRLMTNLQEKIAEVDGKSIPVYINNPVHEVNIVGEESSNNEQSTVVEEETSDDSRVSEDLESLGDDLMNDLAFSKASNSTIKYKNYKNNSKIRSDLNESKQQKYCN